MVEYKKSRKDDEPPTNVKPIIGVRVPKIGVYREEQIKVMVGYYETMEKLSAVSDTVDLIMNTSFRRLYIPDGLNEYAT
ncbi:hypothetical protein PI125_g3473 [Phytophthora idaei]|nr:hypothetical protein PI125_g3473 [Phytophthora idaei]